MIKYTTKDKKEQEMLRELIEVSCEEYYHIFDSYGKKNVRGKNVQL